MFFRRAADNTYLLENLNKTIGDILKEEHRKGRLSTQELYLLTNGHHSCAYKCLRDALETKISQLPTVTLTLVLNNTLNNVIPELAPFPSLRNRILSALSCLWCEVKEHDEDDTYLHHLNTWRTRIKR